MKDRISVQGKTIGVMIGDVSYDYTMELMRGINDAAERNGTQLFYMTGMQRHIAPVDSDNEQETVTRYNSIYDYAKLVGADAYIISSGSLSGIESDEGYQQFLKRFEKLPFVLLQKDMADAAPGRCSITIDNYAIFCQCIEHLILHHHYKKIAYVSGPKRHPEAVERERAYRDMMKKHGLALDEGMVLYGDLSGFVDAQVKKLLTDYPDLEAIAFCNDEMAKSGYKVCESRGLHVGYDIAITGFDDFTTSQTMMPPLTTVSQDAYRVGELALAQALKLAALEPAESIKLNTSLVIRSSCGCSRSQQAVTKNVDAQRPGEYIDTILAGIQEEISGIVAQTEQRELGAVETGFIDRIRVLAKSDPPKPLDDMDLDARLVALTARLKASCGMLAERMYRYLAQMADDIVQPNIRQFYKILYSIQNSLFSYEMRENARRVEQIRTQAWFVPEFIRDLVVIVDEDERVFLNVVNKLRGIGLKNLYLCLLPEPLIRRESRQDEEMSRLLLAAYISDNNTRAYPRARMPVIDETHPMRSLQDLKSAAHMISFSIFSGDVQLGVCICETSRENNPLMHVIGLQLGILLNFLDLKRKERIVAQEIEHVQRKNEELNYLSEYDTLCNIYNRRGFIEQALKLNHDNYGKRAFLVFADLDHLKKINDSFGHAAGDCAIQTASGILKSVIRSGDLIARLSGDEYVGMFIADSTNFRDNFEHRIKQAIEEYNSKSDKPYYVNISIGITDFTCSQDLEISQIINQADQYLYKAKQHKRSSILK